MIKALKEMRILLTEPSNWCQKACARDQNNDAVSPKEPSAKSFCLIGAAQRVANGDDLALQKLPALILQNISHYYGSVAHYNDDPETTHQDIIDLLDQTISGLEQKE